jgi:hypothetical protein
MIEAGLVQLWGLETFKANRRLGTRAADLMKKATSQLDALTQSCPGPYTRKGQDYLESIGALHELPGAWGECARAMAAPFRAKRVSEACAASVDSSAWRRWITEGVASPALGVRRCKGVCQVATGCFGADGSSIPRPLQFGQDWYLSLPPGSCEGRTPLKAADFQRVMLARVFREGASALSKEICSEALKQEAKRTVPHESGRGQAAPLGPELELPADL